MASQKFRQGLLRTQSFFRSYAVVIASFLIMMVSYGVYYSFGIFFKPMLVEFGWSRAMISGAFSLSWVISGAMGIFMGGLTDKYGPRLVLSVCGVIAGIGYLLMSQITSLWQLYLFYGVLIGAGTSLYAPLMSTVARLYVERRTIMTGIVLVGISVGLSVVPPLTNQISLAYDWRISFIVVGVITLLVMLLCAQLFKQNSTRIIQPASEGNQILKEKLTSDADTFTFREAIRTGQFWTIFLSFFCLGFILNTGQVHIVPYATDINISATTAANILATIGAAGIVGRIVLGGVGDRIGNRNAFIIGFILLSLPMFFLAFSKETWMLFLIAAISGLGNGDCVASSSPLVASIFGLKSLGLILGFLSSSYTIGCAVGPVVVAHMFDVTNSYQTAFILTAGIGIIGLVFTTILSPIRTKANFRHRQ